MKAAHNNSEKFTWDSVRSPAAAAIVVAPAQNKGLPRLMAKDVKEAGQTSKRVCQVYGWVATCQDMVEPKDSSKLFISQLYVLAKKRYPRLLTTVQLQDLMRNGCPLVGISDISCDIGGSIEFLSQTTFIDSPFFRYDLVNNSYLRDMEGSGVICSAVDILPTEFAREASQHFGDILSEFVGVLASSKYLDELPVHLRRACILHGGSLTSLFEYIPRIRKSNLEDPSRNLPNIQSEKMKRTALISLSDHLFDAFLINEALDVIEAARSLSNW